MKNTIVSKAAPAIILAVVLAAASTVRAQNIISWSADRYGFDQAVGGSGNPATNTPYGAGVVLALNWNDTWAENWAQGSGTINNLFDNMGAKTSMGLVYGNTSGGNTASVTNFQVRLDADGSYNREMLNGYLNVGGSSSSYVTLSSIPYAQYDIYIYFSSDAAGRTGTITDGTTTYDFSTIGYSEVSGANALLTQTIDTTGANPAADYAVFTGLTGGAQTITCSIANWGGITDFQIIAVPEPGTLALAAMGGVGLLLFGRRNRQLMVVKTMRFVVAGAGRDGVARRGLGGLELKQRQK